MMKILESGVIYRNPMPHVKSRHAYFPSVVRLENGRMVAAFSIGEAFESADLHSYASVSDDGGATWSEPKELSSKVPDFSDFCRISLLADGEIIAIVQRHDRTRPDTGLTNPETQGFTETEFYIQRSRDGETWTTPKRVKEPLVGPSFELCCPIVPLADGTLLFPTSTWQGWDGDRPNGVKMVAFLSKDNGETWDEYVDVMCDPEDFIIYWESRMLQMQDGRILATAWTYDSKQNVDLPDSYVIGDGKSFSKPASTGLTGQTLEPVLLPNGQILSLYRRTDMPGLWGNLSHIEGDAWINDDEMFLWGGKGERLFRTEKNMVENFNVLRFGAPNAFLLDDTTCYVCFWCVEDNVSNIRWLKIDLT